MATNSLPNDEEDWDDYLHGMFKKLKVDPEKVKNSTKCGHPSTKQSTHWYNQTTKLPKKTRRSLASRGSRNRLSPYRNLLTCQAGKVTCEGPLIRSSKFSVPSEGQKEANSKMWSKSGTVKVKFPSGVAKCSCGKWELRCTCTSGESASQCSCGTEAPACRFGSVCKANLSTFRTLATIVEESGELTTKDKRSEKKLPPATMQGDKGAISNDAGEKSGAFAIPHFLNYRNSSSEFNFTPPKISLPASSTTTRYAPRNSNHASGSSGRLSSAPSRAQARPEYSCSQEARMALESLPDDTSVDDLAGYFDSIVHIPRKMSAMAEMMYT